MNENGLFFEFNGMIFDTLKFKRSNKYTDEFFEELLKERSHYNRIKYRDAIEDQLDENIHIYLSYSFVLKVLSILSLIIAVIVGFKYLFITGLIILGIGALSHFGFQFYRKRANEVFAGIDDSKNLVDLIFNEE